jgi:hypothetical protein
VPDSSAKQAARSLRSELIAINRLIRELSGKLPGAPSAKKDVIELEISNLREKYLELYPIYVKQNAGSTLIQPPPAQLVNDIIALADGVQKAITTDAGIDALLSLTGDALTLAARLQGK